MKFSHLFLKRILGPNTPPAKKMAEALNTHSFEVESVEGDVLDIKLPPNRYSDSASHVGIAREVSAIFGLKLKNPEAKVTKPPHRGLIKVDLKNPKLCPRYSAAYVSIPKVGVSPRWMQEILTSSGMKPINAVVDIMNYVMLEMGQPLHAFDAAKLAKSSMKSQSANRTIIVRSAKKGEKIKTLDDQSVALDSDILVIADKVHPLAIAGIKGGANSGVTEKTREIIVEAANFNQASIYKNSKKLKILTDASIRFAHGISPELVELGMNRAIYLLKEILNADILDFVDVYPKKQGREVIGFSVAKFKSLTGAELPQNKISEYLGKLGFEITLPKETQTTSTKKSIPFNFLVTPPVYRIDINNFEDMAEEVIRLYGYNKLKSAPPVVALIPPAEDDIVRFKELVRQVLPGLGFSEVYLSSFVSSGKVAIQNPISEDKKFLRGDLRGHLVKCLEDNLKHFESVKVFEIGKIFNVDTSNKKKTTPIKETWSLALGYAYKKGSGVLEIKGAVYELLGRLGITEFNFKDKNGELLIESGRDLVGKITHCSLDKNRTAVAAELNVEALMNIASEELAFKPLPKFPAVTRDLSILLDMDIKAGDIMQKIEDISQELVEDTDVIDYFEDKSLGENKKSITLRIVFRAEDRTLTDNEVDEEMEKIVEGIQNTFTAVVR